MPAGDRTGPRGLGAMTGRAAGFCAGYPVPGYANAVPGPGFGGGGFSRGGGWGRRNMFYATGLTGWQRRGTGYPSRPSFDPNVMPANQQAEIDMLKAQSEYMEKSLEGIHKRINELEDQKNVTET